METKQASKEFLDIEKNKALLVGQLYRESFYGVLGIHPKASVEDIENGFKIKLREIAKLNKEDKKIKLAIILKAYSTLTSSYKEDYDEYLENYKNGIIKAVELFYSQGDSSEELVKSIQPLSTGIQPWALFMQPWATSN